MDEITKLQAELARLRPIAERTGCLLADYEEAKAYEERLKQEIQQMGKERTRLQMENAEARALLQSVIDGCVHPDKAIWRLFVDVRPIRKFLHGKDSTRLE